MASAWLTRFAWLFDVCRRESGEEDDSDDIGPPPEDHAASTQADTKEIPFTDLGAGDDESMQPIAAYRSLGAGGDDPSPSEPPASEAAAVPKRAAYDKHVQLKHLVKLGCLANGDTFVLGKLTAVVATTANGAVGLRIKLLDNELKSGLHDFCKDHYDPTKSFLHELFGEEAASYGPCDPDVEGLFEPWVLSVNCFVRAGAHLQPDLVSNKSQGYECPMLKSTLRSLWPQPTNNIEDTYTLLSIRLAFAFVSGWDFKSGEPGSAWALDHDLVAIRDKASTCREMEMAVVMANENISRAAAVAAAAAVARKAVKAAEPPTEWEDAVNRISTPPRPYEMCEDEVSDARVAFWGKTVNQAPTAKNANAVVLLLEHLTTLGEEFGYKVLFPFLTNIFFEAKDGPKRSARRMGAFGWSLRTKDSDSQLRFKRLLDARSTELSTRARDYLRGLLAKNKLLTFINLLNEPPPNARKPALLACPAIASGSGSSSAGGEQHEAKRARTGA